MRLEQLTFTRFIAAISIVVFHYGHNVFPFNLVITNFIFKQANVGVSYFFILSGFVMIIAHYGKSKINFGAYMKKRLFRIYPAYFLAIVILFTYLKFVEKPIVKEELFLNLTMIQSWFPRYALTFNFPAWSIAIEMFFYLSFPFLFNGLYKKYQLKKIAIPILLIFISSQVIFHLLLHSSYYEGFPSPIHCFVFHSPIMHFSEFLIGNIAGLFFMKGIKKRNYDWLIVGLIILFAILLKFNLGINFHNGMLAFIFVPLIILISANNGILTKVSNGKIPVFLGEISYGIYILQYPVYSWVKLAMNNFEIQNLAIVFYISLIVLIAISAMSYTLIEAPLRMKINTKRTQKTTDLLQ